MAGLGRLIAALAATAAADTHFGYIGTGSMSITQPDVLTPSFNVIDGSVEYSGKYHLVNGRNSFDLTSSGGARHGWCVSQHFQVPVPSPGSHLRVDYKVKGVFGRSDGYSSRGTKFSRIVPPYGAPARPPRVELVRALSEPDIMIKFRMFGDAGLLEGQYAMNKEGLHIVQGEKHTLLVALNTVLLHSGKLIVPITPVQHILIRPDFGEIIVDLGMNSKTYQRWSWHLVVH